MNSFFFSSSLFAEYVCSFPLRPLLQLLPAATHRRCGHKLLFPACAFFDALLLLWSSRRAAKCENIAIFRRSVWHFSNTLCKVWWNFFESWKCDLKYIYIYLLILQTFNEHYRIYGYESLLLLILFRRTVAVHFTATHEASFGIQCLPYWLKLYASVRLQCLLEGWTDAGTRHFP